MPDVYINTDTAPGTGLGTPASPYSSRDEAFEAKDINIGDGETWRFFESGVSIDRSEVVVDGIYAGTTLPVIVRFLPWHTFFGAVSDHAAGWYTGNLDFSNLHYRALGPGGGTGNEDVITLHVDFPTAGSIAHEVEVAGQLGDDAGGRGRGLVTSGGTGVQILRLRKLRYKSFSTGIFPRVWRGAGTNDRRGWHPVIIENLLMHYTGSELMSVMNPNYVAGAGNTTIHGTNLTAVFSGTNGEDLLDNRDTWIARLRNVVCLDNTGGDNSSMVGGGTIDRDYIAHQRTDSRGANGTSSSASDFENDAGNDFRPSATSVWRAAGLTNAEDSLVPLDDINGNPRNNGVGQFTSFGAFAASNEGPAPPIGTDDLLADDIEATSNVDAGTVGQVHAFTATSIDASAEVGSVAVGQVHILAATSVQSVTELSTPSIGQQGDLVGDDISAATEVGTAALGQSHVLAGQDANLATEVGAGTPGQVHAFAGDSIEAASELTAPALTRRFVFDAANLDAITELSRPSLGTEGTDALSAEDLNVVTFVDAGALGQLHILAGDSIASALTISPTSLNGSLLPVSDGVNLIGQLGGGVNVIGQLGDGINLLGALGE